MSNQIKLCVLFLLACFIAPVKAQTTGTNIWLGQLETKEGIATIKGLKQLTFDDNYTNQAYFFDDETLFYTQMLGTSESDFQTDIFKYNLKTDTITNVTQSTTSEYSPTPIPKSIEHFPVLADGYMSVIRVNKEGKQELWSINARGQAQKNLLPAIEPVGYQVWLNQHQLALFVLGEPHRLVLADVLLPNSSGKTLASSPGPSLFLHPKSSLLSFTTPVSADNEKEGWLLHLADVSGQALNIKKTVSLPKSAYYYAWSHDGDLLTTDKGKLLIKEISTDSEQTNEFREVEGSCSNDVSRIAVSKSGQIALVCNN